jgi:response regulator NasT
MSEREKKKSTAARILVADDDRLVLYTVAQGLSSAGYEVLQASSGAQALEICAKSNPDLALLDMRMPDLTGTEVAAALRCSGEIPVLFLSAYGDSETVRAAVAEGALGYLVKPLDVVQILPAIEAALARAAELRKLRDSEKNLNVALQCGREISMAIGLVMERYKLPQEQAFESLRDYARSHRTKLSEIAAVLVGGKEPDGFGGTLKASR